MPSDQREDKPPTAQADQGAATADPSTVARSDEFLRVLVHELRNHVAPIRNAAHLIRLRAGSDPELSLMVDMIERQVSGIVRALEVIVDAERASHGDVALASEEIDLALAVASAADRAKPMFDARSQRLHASLPQEPIWVRADRARIAQVLDTLLDNAAQYTDANGEIWLDTLPSASRVEVRVRDSGSGIAADFLPHVFDYFAGRSRCVHGIGVGLAVARALVERQGGRLHAASAGERKGSEFVIELPVVTRGGDTAAQEPAQATRRLDAPSGEASQEIPSKRRSGPSPLESRTKGRSGRRILIADDSAAVRDSLASLLRDMGHEVRGARDGDEALELAASWQPDFVLLDIHMPKLNGFKVARELRGRVPSTRMHLVMMSGNTLDEATLAGAKAAGFDTCIDKVFAFSELEKLLNA